MNYYQKPNLFKRILFSPITALIIILVVLAMAYAVFSIVDKSVDAARARKLSEKEVAELAEKKADLTHKLDALRSPEGQEAALREHFPVVKEGEHVIVIVDEQKKTEGTQETEAPKKGFWQFLKNLFK